MEPRRRYSIQSPKSKVLSPFRKVSTITQPALKISMAAVSNTGSGIPRDGV